jgi:hypothetical protein
VSEQDPKRLLDEASSGDLQALLTAGRSEVPSQAQMLVLAAKIGVIAAAGAGGAGAAGAGAGAGTAGAGAAGASKAALGAATAVKAGIAIKVIGAVAIAGVAGAGAVVVSNRRVEPTAPVGLVATSAPHASTSATTATTASAAVALPAASVESPPRSVPTSSTASAEIRNEGPEAEVKLLERAQDALRSHPAEALALCNDHTKRFPSGMLVQEREVIAIEALLKTGRKDEAQARANRFKTRFPGSSHTRRLETLLAN